MFLIVVLGTTSTLGQPIISPSCFSNSHDITSLQAWGPYSKRYAGISHPRYASLEYALTFP